MDQPENIRSYFNALAPLWTDRPEDHAARTEIIRRAALPENAVVADIGSGKGVMLPYLLSTNPQSIIAVDFAEDMLQQASKKYRDERITFIAGDLLTAELPPLDAALIFNAYPHFLDKEKLSEKLSRHIKPGGILIIAHSVSKETINGRHNKSLTFTLSVPLRDAAVEAQEFASAFEVDCFEDSDALYFIRMVRRGKRRGDGGDGDDGDDRDDGDDEGLRRQTFFKKKSLTKNFIRKII